MDDQRDEGLDLSGCIPVEIVSDRLFMWKTSPENLCFKTGVLQVHAQTGLVYICFTLIWTVLVSAYFLMFAYLLDFFNLL